jgi:hypothetical protein
VHLQKSNISDEVPQEKIKFELLVESLSINCNYHTDYSRFAENAFIKDEASKAQGLIY